MVDHKGDKSKQPPKIIEALFTKVAKNKARQWPDWRTLDPNKAIEHTR